VIPAGVGAFTPLQPLNDPTEEAMLLPVILSPRGGIAAFEGDVVGTDLGVGVQVIHKRSVDLGIVATDQDDLDFNGSILCVDVDEVFFFAVGMAINLHQMGLHRLPIFVVQIEDHFDLTFEIREWR
jgi:hypothetical protein